jgi:hypothetical protein
MAFAKIQKQLNIANQVKLHKEFILSLSQPKTTIKKEQLDLFSDLEVQITLSFQSFFLSCGSFPSH